VGPAKHILHLGPAVLFPHLFGEGCELVGESQEVVPQFREFRGEVYRVISNNARKKERKRGEEIEDPPLIIITPNASSPFPNALSISPCRLSGD
jgi:hypothetical protein